MNLGDVYALYPPHSNAKRHHYVVVSSPSASGSVVCFNWTDAQFHPDKTCVLEVGDHPDIVKRSVIAYVWGAVISPLQIRTAMAEHFSFKKTPVSSDLLERIQRGAHVSSRTPAELLPLVPNPPDRSR